MSIYWNSWQISRKMLILKKLFFFCGIRPTVFSNTIIIEHKNCIKTPLRRRQKSRKIREFWVKGCHSTPESALLSINAQTVFQVWHEMNWLASVSPSLMATVRCNQSIFPDWPTTAHPPIYMGAPILPFMKLKHQEIWWNFNFSMTWTQPNLSLKNDILVRDILSLHLTPLPPLRNTELYFYTDIRKPKDHQVIFLFSKWKHWELLNSCSLLKVTQLVCG